MNRIIRILAGASLSGIVLLGAASCGNKTEDPTLTAIKEKIIASVQKSSSTAGGEVHVQINKFEKIDSVTYGQELEYRKGLFNTKLKKTQQLYDKYMKQGKPNNAKLKLEEIGKTKEIIEGLVILEENIKDSLDIVAYYDYFISGKAYNKVSEINFDQYYASVTPGNEVLYLNSDKRGLHRTNGRVIPGYMALLKGESEEETAE